MTDTQEYSFLMGYSMDVGDEVEVPKTGETGEVVDCEQVHSDFLSKNDEYRITVELPADLDIAKTPKATNVEPVSIGYEFKEEVEQNTKPPNRRETDNHHIAAQCPNCQKDTGVPVVGLSGKIEGQKGGLRDLCCYACGHRWEEDDDLEVADAWFGFGAYEALYENGHI